MINKELLELETKWAELLKGPKRINPEVREKAKAISAIALAAQLEKDEVYQKWLKEKEEVGLLLELAYKNDEKPLIYDLAKAGVSISSCWDLVNTNTSYKSAIPILIEHLSKPYHIKNKEGIVRALTVKEAKGIACRAIIDEYRKAPKDKVHYCWTYGNAMAIIITAEYIDDVIEIVQNESNGESRQMFVNALGKTKSLKAKGAIQRLLNDKDKSISNEAQKAIKKIK
jgi:hypothetical protein